MISDDDTQALLVVLQDLFKTSATVWCRCFCLSTNVRQTCSSPTSCRAHSSLSLAASAIAQLTIADISTNRNGSMKVLKCQAIAITFTHTKRGSKLNLCLGYLKRARWQWSLSFHLLCPRLSLLLLLQSPSLVPPTGSFELLLVDNIPHQMICSALLRIAQQLLSYQM